MSETTEVNSTVPPGESVEKTAVALRSAQKALAKAASLELRAHADLFANTALAIATGGEIVHGRFRKSHVAVEAALDLHERQVDINRKHYELNKESYVENARREAEAAGCSITDMVLTASEVKTDLLL